MIRVQEDRVSYTVGKDDETKYWDGGVEHCEVVGEGSYNQEQEEQEWMASTDYEMDDHDLQIALAMSDEDPRMDEELAKRLSDLDSVPHVPKVNAEIPPVEALSDKQRLQERLSAYRLAEKQIAGDGNCQFRALSDQLYLTPNHHMFVRRRVVDQLTRAPESYSGYIPMEYKKYLKNMARYGEWGDHVTLQAAADFYGVKINLITTYKESGFIEIIPVQLKSNRGVYLSFWSEIHYNSIYAIEDGASFTKQKKEKKKKSWLPF